MLGGGSEKAVLCIKTVDKERERERERKTFLMYDTLVQWH